VTKFAAHRTLEIIASCKLTFDEKVVVHQVDRTLSGPRRVSTFIVKDAEEEDLGLQKGNHHSSAPVGRQPTVRGSRPPHKGVATPV